MHTGETFDPWKMTKLFAGLGAGVALAIGLFVMWHHWDSTPGGQLTAWALGTLLGSMPGALLFGVGAALDRMRLTSYALRQGAPQRIYHHRW
jgi:hypothetical protein